MTQQPGNEADFIHEELDVLQADLDDESPQVLAHAVERALSMGALDAHLSPLVMKRGRPGVRVEVLCRRDKRGEMLELLMTETSTLGVKVRTVERYSLARQSVEVRVEGEPVRIKLALRGERVLRAVPEFRDCQAAAEKLGLAVRDVIERARAAYGSAAPQRGK